MASVRLPLYGQLVLEHVCRGMNVLCWPARKLPVRLLVTLIFFGNSLLIMQLAQTKWLVVEDATSSSYSFKDRHIYQHANFHENDTITSECLSRVKNEYIPFLLAHNSDYDSNPAKKLTIPTKEKELCLFLKVMRKMEYTVYGDVFDAKINPNISQITLVTQLSHVRLERFALHAAKWPGPISMALYVPQGMLLPTMLAWCRFKELCTRDNIQLHVIVEKGIFYPVNYLRNVAVKYVKTDLTYVVDADVMPMPGMEAMLHEHLQRHPLNTTQVLVIPTFESYDGSCCDTMPKTKHEMIKLWDQGVVGPFYFERYKPAYAPIRYQRWKVATEAYIVPFHKQFEPYIIMHTKRVPAFHTGFFGLYFDKATFTLEVYSMGHDFIVLPNIFNFHIYHDFTHNANVDSHFLCMFKAWQDFMKSMAEKYGEDKSFPPAFDEEEVELDEATLKKLYAEREKTEKGRKAAKA
ncbi:hypothetical protein CAPTEDRAFT_227063 [Capitella teleta]|uniref:Glycosyltransferase-like protein LARGE2 n=1 Tax=Capitella teleta TaxID=283909 RepID=R7TIC8_CAPTE|nr:hypothetical protein CAPTEDRAFT_227063 [Capitella teleta]|eukprot:ELT93598.1 hypothetical protein CAPTEDRAFT_227063 [Capitella teleta]